MPATRALLDKTKLPFGVHLFPLASSEPVPVIDHTVITRCRVCRTYINPFSTFLSHGRRWRCNMCFRVHDLPADYDYDPAKRTHVRSDAILVYPILAYPPRPTPKPRHYFPSSSSL